MCWPSWNRPPCEYLAWTNYKLSLSVALPLSDFRSLPEFRLITSQVKAYTVKTSTQCLDEVPGRPCLRFLLLNELMSPRGIDPDKFHETTYLSYKHQQKNCLSYIVIAI